MIDVVERHALKSLSRRVVWDDDLAPDQHDTAIRLCAKGLAESVKVEPAHKFKRGGVFFRITDKGVAEL